MRKYSKYTLLQFGAIMAVIMAAPLAASAQDGLAQSAEAVLSEQKSAYEMKMAEQKAVIDQSIADAKLELESEEVRNKKLDLAKRIHEIRPTKDQIDDAIERAAASLPEVKREGFKASMRAALNYNAIEKISIDAMVETFTLKEMMSMLEYYQKPEAMSASKKLGIWAGQVQPEIVRMIDRAIMRARLGQ